KEEGCDMTTKTAKTAASAARAGKARKSRKPRPAPKAAAFVAEVRKKLGVSRKVFSRLTGYSERAIANWERGDQPDEPGLRRIRETERFQARLAELVRPEEIPQWLE